MIYFIGAGPGDPELLTLKGKRILEQCEVVIYAGSLVNREILRYAKNGVQLHDSSKLHLGEIITLMEEAHKKGYAVARLHSGDPSLYGALREQIEELRKRNIPFEIVPGVSSFQAAAALLERELTMPGVTQTVILTRLGGKTPVPEREGLRSLASHHATMVIFLSLNRIAQVVEELSWEYPKDTPIAILHRVGWDDEKVIVGTLSDIMQKIGDLHLARQGLIIVGETLGERFSSSFLYHPAFSHGFRKGQ